jgi:hypothetical protein
MPQKARDNDAESFYVKVSCDELKFLLLRGSKCMKSKGKATSSDSLEIRELFDTIF